jgi:hypothetical protein
MERDMEQYIHWISKRLLKTATIRIILSVILVMICILYIYLLIIHPDQSKDNPPHYFFLLILLSNLIFHKKTNLNLIIFSLILLDGIFWYLLS